MPFEEPGRHQFHFRDQPRLVVLGQTSAVGLDLKAHQTVERLPVQRIDGVGRQRRQQQAVAEIGHHHEAVLGIAGDHFRRQQPGLTQAEVDLQPGTDVLALRRCIHDDPRPMAGVAAPIAAETGIGRGRVQIEIGIAGGGAGKAQAIIGAVGGSHAGHGVAVEATL